MLVDLRNRDVYRSAFEDAGVGWGYTRPSEFSWVRIDQILASPAFTFTSCWVGPAFGSDHKSLIAEAIFAR
jgi:endonuclease/exonuclease/phosphatase (EEP) superfamily protein YafD